MASVSTAESSTPCPSPSPRVLSIQSHVIHGYVGNKAATFPLQLWGFDVDPVNTVQFCNHTGYPSFTGTKLKREELVDLMEGLAANKLDSYSHLLTGYIGNPIILEEIAALLTKLRKRNPNLRFVCDPVMGDHGKFYVPPDAVPQYKKMLSITDVITPNQFEAELLLDMKIQTIEDGFKACDKFHEIGVRTVILSSMDFAEDRIVSLASRKLATDAKPERLKLELAKLPYIFVGTGDLFTASILNWTSKHPDDFKLAFEKAMATVQGVLRVTVACGGGELQLVRSRQELENPTVLVTAESV